MSVYRVDLLNGKFYIGKTMNVDLKKRMRDHRCKKGSGLAVWFPDEDFTTAKISVFGLPTPDEPLCMLEDRLIREHLDDPMNLNKNRGYRTSDEVKKQKKESYKKFMAEHPEKKAEYDAVYREKHAEEKKQRDKEYYEQHRQDVIQKQRDYYHANKEKVLASQKAGYAKKKEAEKSLGE
jgi:hypothetical protein